MLDLFSTSPEAVGHRLPMDFSPYLLSASPPGAGFDLMGYSGHRSHVHLGIDPLPFDNANYSAHPSFPSLQMSQPGHTNLNKRRNGPLKSIIIRPESCSDSEGESSSSAPESPHSPGRTPKKVSFADHKGLALAQVRLVKEGPDEPPQLNPEMLSSLTLGANADVTCKPPIRLCFSQPASDYLAFRDKISRNLVSLENVILRDYSVEGTIKVKNITFEKRVFVRLSLDEWESFEDFEGTFVPGPGLSYSDPYDTFSFTMEVSPTFDVSKQLQFAVCFEENGQQHWDNNDGANYCIVSEHYGQHTAMPPAGPTFNPRWLPEKRTDTWAEFSVWRDVDSHGPYY
ncbi:protein phosphatase 1 regulatory subunit 3B [Aplysia californica]|uniref:Protein phosphatase 1 regulatory subunit 3B n=1 Tax=Aplysia californica TaxID=6500 RepID=A0ABM0K022_APLCA|nr:protein phosphatase 1 regulatory subunit 3B [Aplysia californica]XP_005105569.1 protein phosphatase 1 regulatory subunit 3B [Aplysia californica]